MLNKIFLMGRLTRDPELRRRLTEMFGVMLRDNRQSRRLCADGTYVRVQNEEPPLSSQEYFCRRAAEAAQLAAAAQESAPENSG